MSTDDTRPKQCKFTHPSGLPCLAVRGIDLAADGCEVCGAVCLCLSKLLPGEPSEPSLCGKPCTGWEDHDDCGALGKSCRKPCTWNAGHESGGLHSCMGIHPDKPPEPRLLDADRALLHGVIAQVGKDYQPKWTRAEPRPSPVPLGVVVLESNGEPHCIPGLPPCPDCREAIRKEAAASPVEAPPCNALALLADALTWRDAHREKSKALDAYRAALKAQTEAGKGAPK